MSVERRCQRGPLPPSRAPMSAVERRARAPAPWPPQAPQAPHKKLRLSPVPDDDCVSLAWLLNFRLDSLTEACSRESSPPAPSPPAPTVGCFPPAQPPALASSPAALKPPYTYTELVEKALKEKGQLNVSGIYRWISEHYPFYKATDERWKNCVRHNLSINPHFRKGARASRGAGHLWSLAECGGEIIPLRNPPPALPALPAAPHRDSDQAEVAAAVSALESADGIHTVIEIFPDRSFSAFLNPVSSEQVARECGLLAPD